MEIGSTRSIKYKAPPVSHRGAGLKVGKQFVVFGVGTDPNPNHAFRLVKSERPVMDTYPRRHATYLGSIDNLREAACESTLGRPSVCALRGPNSTAGTDGTRPPWRRIAL